MRADRRRSRRATLAPLRGPRTAAWGRLVAIGLASGVFASLFGVGGGIVMVPLLIVLLAYDARAATATSLAAIIITATAGAAPTGCSATSTGARRS